MGWIDGQTTERHPCGKVLGFTDAVGELDTHTMCAECATKYLSSLGYSQERIKELLCRSNEGQS